MQAMQLDIFDDGRDTMLRNDVVHALEQRDAAAARSAWRVFNEEFAGDETLPLLAVLIDAIEGADTAAFADHAAVHQARRTMADAIEPAAARIFGAAAATAWLAPLWQAQARRAAALAFRSECSDDHAAPLWLRGGAWPAAAEAVARIESWRRIPAPLAWMAEARYRIDGLEASWSLLAELAWLSPGRFDALTKRLAEPSLDKLRKRFDASFDAGVDGSGDIADLAWFPAWVLTEKAGLARWLGEAQPSLQRAPEQAMRLLVELIGLERQGRHHDVVQRRKVLRDLQPALYSAYMKTR